MVGEETEEERIKVNNSEFNHFRLFDHRRIVSGHPECYIL